MPPPQPPTTTTTPLAAGTNAADTLNLHALRTKFASIDRNGDGRLTQDELITLLKQNGMDPASATHHARFFGQLTTQTSNTINGITSTATASSTIPATAGVTYAEFVQEYVRMTRFQALKSIQTRFKQVDTNGDGMISRDELRLALNQQIGEQETQARFDTIFNEMDTNRDGVIDLREFWNWYRMKSSQIMQQEELEKAQSL